MAISIVDEEVERMVRRLAEVTGTTVDEAVREAVQARLAVLPDRELRVRDDRPGDEAAERRLTAMRAALAEIHANMRRLPTLDPRSPEEMLYDEYGLPK